MFGAGFDDGRGHITAYIGYRDIAALLAASRDYGSCSLTARTNAQVAGGPGAGGVTDFTCGGSGTSANGTLFTNTETLQVGPNRTFVPGSTPYNFGPLNHYQRPDERYVGGVFANYEISPALKPYMEFMFMDDRTTAQIAPSGDFGNTLTLNCDNPLLSAQQLAIICAPGNLTGFAPPIVDDPATPVDETFAGSPPTVFIDPTTGLPYFRGNAQILRRNVEGGPRQDTLQHTSFRAVAGMRGDLSDAWSYDAYYQFGRVNFAETYLNEFSVTRLGRAVDVIDDPRTPGVDPICRSVLDGTDPNCVPYDMFALGQVSPGAIGYLSTPGFQRGYTEQTVASASMTGNLGTYGVQFPWASSGVGVAFGLEYRKEKLELNTDVAFQTGDLAGQGAPTLPIQGQYDVREAFAEVRIPIVEENFIHELSLEAGYRYSDYSGSNGGFSTDTYKIGGFFAPIRDIRFRATYNRAVRAPNIQDLFATQRVALNGSIDPCAGDLDPTTATPAPSASAAECALTGVSDCQYGNIAPNPAEQYNGLIGGNPNLTPEVADTMTVGVVLQPRFLPRFALTVDFFDIKIKNTITQIGQDTILTTCIDSADPTFCGAINRDQFGSLWRTSNGYIVDLTTNIGSLSTRGVDIQASYSHELGSLGSLGFNFVGTWLDELVTDNGVSTPYDCVGFYGNQCGTPNPEWRHTARVTWNLPDGIGLSGRWRYFSAVSQDTSSTNPTLSGTTQPANLRIPSQSYFDLTLSARIGDHYSFRLGVNNILDRDPPLIGAQACPAGICSNNTYTQVYDALGRYIFAGVTLDF
jgi:outer membrane receptor protein involved in Fe transport